MAFLYIVLVCRDEDEEVVFECVDIEKVQPANII